MWMDNKDMWYQCSKCGQKLFRINKDSVVHGIEVKCKKCRHVIEINIEPMSRKLR